MHIYIYCFYFFLTSYTYVLTSPPGLSTILAGTCIPEHPARAGDGGGGLSPGDRAAGRCRARSARGRGRGRCPFWLGPSPSLLCPQDPQSPGAEQFRRAAGQIAEVPFGLSSSAAVLSHYGAAENTVVLFRTVRGTATGPGASRAAPSRDALPGKKLHLRHKGLVLAPRLSGVGERGSWTTAYSSKKHKTHLSLGQAKNRVVIGSQAACPPQSTSLFLPQRRLLLFNCRVPVTERWSVNHTW